MLFERCPTKNRKRSPEQHIKYFNFRIKIQLDHPLQITPNTANLLIDRPFLFVIRDRKKRIPLFVGRVMDPAKKE